MTAPSLPADRPVWPCSSLDVSPVLIRGTPSAAHAPGLLSLHAGRPVWPCTSLEVSRAFRKLSILVHPDKNPGEDARCVNVWMCGEHGVNLGDLYNCVLACSSECEWVWGIVV